ncbi:MAG TPA: hypothetical protein VGD56_08605, partial [Gemmatirosa sp.]
GHHGVDLTALAEDPAHRDHVRELLNPARAARRAAGGDGDGPWTPPVLRSVASKGEGVDDVLDALARHRRYLEASGQLAERRRVRLRERVVEITEEKLRRRLWNDAGTMAWLDDQLPAVQAGEATPFAVADAVIARSGELLGGTRSSAPPRPDV